MEHITIDELMKNAGGNSPYLTAQIIGSMLNVMSLPMVAAIICTVLDAQFASRGLTEEEALDMYDGICESAHAVYKEMGMARREE